MNPEIKKLLEREQKELTEGAKNLSTKRRQWNDFADRAKKLFSEITEDDKVLSFDKLVLHDSRNDTEIPPLHFIVLSWGGRFITVSKTNGSKHFHSEHGGAIVFSQNIWGDIICVVYPLKSDFHKMAEESLSLSSFNAPTWYTEEKIIKLIDNFFFCSRKSSVLGQPSVWERIRIYWLRFKARWHNFYFEDALDLLLNAAPDIIKNGLPQGGSESSTSSSSAE